MSESKIKELYPKLAEKRIDQIKARAEGASGSVLVKLEWEIIGIRREIEKEIQALERQLLKTEAKITPDIPIFYEPL